MVDETDLMWRSRGENVRATRKKRLDQLFHGRKFVIEREVHLPMGQVFETVLGNRGRHGYIIRDEDNGERFVFGLAILRVIHDQYHGIELPPRRPRGRPPRSRATTETAAPQPATSS